MFECEHVCVNVFLRASTCVSMFTCVCKCACVFVYESIVHLLVKAIQSVVLGLASGR